MADRQLDFQSLHAEYRPRILRYLARVAGESDAEDLAQEVFDKVSRSLASFRGASSTATWIYRIANHAAMDRLRSIAAQRGDKTQSIDDLDDMEDRSVRTDERVIREEMNACIRSIIADLPESYRSVIILGDLEGFSDAEIADILGLSLQAAKIRIHRARKRLREELKNACVFYRNHDDELACDRRPPVIQIEASLRK